MSIILPDDKRIKLIRYLEVGEGGATLYYNIPTEEELPPNLRNKKMTKMVSDLMLI